MSGESKRHEEIREDIGKELKDKYNLELGKDFYMSHEKGGTISFFLNHEIPVAKPDILIRKNGKVLVIEIELRNTPKHLLGVAFAIFASKSGKNKDTDFNFEKKSIKKSLLIVIDSKRAKIDISNSCKSVQINQIASIIRDTLKLDMDIVTEDEAPERMQNWMEKGELTACASPPN